MEYPQKDVIVGEQWLVLSKIGEGSFGEVFKAQDIDLKCFYAVKRESLDLEHPQLHHESIVYDVLAGGPCIPKCYWYGQHDGFDCIVIDLLGPSLKQLQETIQGDNIPLDLIIDIGCQLISCLEHIHDRGLVYRDIKPENFLFSASCVLVPSSFNTNNNYNSPPPSPLPITTTAINTTATATNNSMLGNNWDRQLYAVDFGLTTWWRNPKTKKPYPECKKPIKYKTGTARYASLNVHRGRTHARRDDMESLGYLLLDLLLGGELPWSGVTARTSKVGWDRLKSIKEEILLQDMCLGLPHGIMDYIDYTRRLRFGDRPDYDYLRRLLRGCNESGPFSKLVVPHPHTRMIPSPPKYNGYNCNNNGYYQKKSATGSSSNSHLKRRNSTANITQQNNYYYSSSRKQQPPNDDVFIMDDLAKELPSIVTRKSSCSFNNRNHRRYHSSSNSNQSSRHYYYKRNNNNSRQFVGWNTHKNMVVDQQQGQWELPYTHSLQTP